MAKIQRDFISPRHIMFYEHQRGVGFIPFYVGRSNIISLFENNSLSLIDKFEKSFCGISIIDNQEIEFSLRYGNERAYREVVNEKGNQCTWKKVDENGICSIISRGETMLFDEYLTIESLEEDKTLNQEIINIILKNGFKEVPSKSKG